MKTIFAVSLSLLLSGLAVAQTASTQPSTRGAADADFRSRYAVLAERNMFVKDRESAIRNASRSGEPTSRPSRPPPEKSFLLIGLVEEDDGDYRAYFESVDGGSVTQVKPGDDFAGGKVVAIEINSIQFQLRDRQLTVYIGQDLTGERAGVSASTVASSQPVDPANMTAEERLRQRRLQELRK